MKQEARASPARRISIALAVLGAIVIAVVLVMRRSATSDPRTEQARRDMISDLRGLAAMEYTSRQLVGRFSSDPDGTGHLSSFGVNRPVITLVDSGYTAIVTHAAVRGLRCGIGVYARNPLSRWAKPGEIICR